MWHCHHTFPYFFTYGFLLSLNIFIVVTLKPFSVKFEIWLLSQFLLCAFFLVYGSHLFCMPYMYMGWGRKRDISIYVWGPQVVLVGKNLPANVGDIRNVGSNPGLIRSLGGRHSNTLQYSCLENPVDGGAWRAMVHGVAKSRAQLKQLSMHTYTHIYIHAQYICC